jgi:hypothetical protein
MENNILKNKNFFYLQYNKINWKNQEKTKINSFISNYIIQNIILNHKNDSIAIFDIGFGIGLFIKMLINNFKKRYKDIIIEGCDPSKVNYEYFLNKKPKILGQDIILNTYQKTFQDVETKTKFDFITAIYVFPYFLFEELEMIIKKIYSMLKAKGKFILVLADEKYLEDKLKIEKDLFIEIRDLTYKDKRYKEILHYSDIPKIGKVIDYNREEKFYIDLFEDNKFILSHKGNINDSGFVCTLFVFEKK